MEIPEMLDILKQEHLGAQQAPGRIFGDKKRRTSGWKHFVRNAGTGVSCI